MDVRARAATFLSRRPFNSELRGGGFAPRHLSRSASSRFNRETNFEA